VCIFNGHYFLLLIVLVLLGDLCQVSQRNVFLLNYVQRALEVTLLNFGLYFFDFITQRCVGLHHFEGSLNLKPKISLIDIYQIVPKSLLIMLKDECFEVFLVGLCGDK
jgi:hypothetical protein